MGAEERVDVVDERDIVVGVETRAAVRAGHLWHRAVYVLLFNSAGELFVHRRTAGKDVYPSFCDVAVGGVVESGESYEEAARRELAEEVGVRDVPLRRVLRFRFEDATNRIQGVVFTCTCDGPLRLQPEEIDSGAFESLPRVLERVSEEPFCPDGITALSHYLNLLERVRQERSSFE